MNLIRTSLMENLSQGEFEVDNYLAECSDEMDRIIRKKNAVKAYEYEQNRRIVTDIRYKSEIFALNCPPVEAFRIVVEESVEGNHHKVVVKKIRCSYSEPYYRHDEIILSTDEWNESY